jgi:nucleotide-binding universal stress UspA family protein
VIAQIAEKTGAEVILIGTRGHAPVAGLLLGSVTQRLLHIAPCPVLAIPPHYTRKPADAGEAVATAS